MAEEKKEEAAPLDYKALRLMNVAQLRHAAKTTPGMHGAESMDRERLLAEICKRRQIAVLDLSGDVDVMRSETKQRLRDLQSEREAAEAKGDSAALARIRAEVHKAKGKLRRAK
ncbi:MAG: hypothetical protein FJ091_18210 [Deltaproteobacteria bacterium]|nr:hypothetical protein [Deltaproteobacteria bacterium]